MSGHSKWAQIKRQKGVKDVRRGLTFTKLGNAISIAVRQGGGIGDPDQNFRLRLAVEAARAANMPKENIARAIDRAVGKQSAALDMTVYEGFGPHGVSIIVEAATDNKNRTTGEVASIFNKNGGTMGQPGSVAYQFKQVGHLKIKKNGKLLDDIYLIAADAGAEDIQDFEDNEAIIYTAPSDLNKIRLELTKAGIEVSEMEIIRIPAIPITILTDEEVSKVIDFIDKLEDIDDVLKVYSNLSLSE